MKKVTKEFIIENEYGLHARPSASFVKKASNFNSTIKVENDKGDSANGKSIISLMCLTVKKGDKIKVTVKGNDAEKAMFAISNLVESNFGELF